VAGCCGVTSVMFWLNEKFPRLYGSSVHYGPQHNLWCHGLMYPAENVLCIGVLCSSMDEISSPGTVHALGACFMFASCQPKLVFHQPGARKAARLSQQMPSGFCDRHGISSAMRTKRCPQFREDLKASHVCPKAGGAGCGNVGHRLAERCCVR